jgi:glycerol-3-phosphate acyltransferase PlsY
MKGNYVAFSPFMAIYVLLIVVAYLLGSVSTAIITCRVLGLTDPRSAGSGNPGATNVLRTAGKRAAAITFLGDVCKGLAPVIITWILVPEERIVGTVALAAFLGHLYPIYYSFKGGKGVATALGALLGMHTLTGICALSTWLLVAILSRYSSLAALAAGLATPLYMLWLTGSAWLTGATLVMAVFIFWRHRGNIRNLIQGSEDTIGSKL